MGFRGQLRRIETVVAIAIVLASASSACALLVETTDLTEGKSDAAAPPKRDPRVSDASTGASDDGGAPSDVPPDDPPPTDPGGGATGSDAAANTLGDDAGNDAGAVVVNDAGALTGIACGAQTCAPGSSVCCYSFDAGPLGCATSCPSSQLALPCDDPADCAAAGHPGTECCVTIGPSPLFHATSVQCKSSCPATGGTTPFCAPNDGVHTCPSGTSCQASTLNVPGYRVCK